ncbi:MAG: type I secretion system permease/ATPase [Albidovulum sp.]
MKETSTKKASGELNAYRVALRSIWPSLMIAGVFSAIVNILMLTGSVYMLEVYDRVLGSGSVPTLMGLFTVVVILFAFLAYYDFLRGRILSRAALRLDGRLGVTTFGAWLRAGREAGGSGRGMQQPLRDLESVRGFLSSPAVTGIFDLPWMPLYLAVLFLVHPWLGWLTVAGALVVIALALVNRMMTRRAMEQASGFDMTERRFSDRSQALAAALLPMGMERALTARWNSLHTATLAGGQRGANASEVLVVSSRAFRMLLQSAILTLGALLVIRGEMSGGMIVAASIISGRALAPVDQVIGQWRSIGRAIEAHRGLEAFFEGEARKPVVEMVDLPRPSGNIEVAQLTKYAPASQAGAARAHILNKISFSLESGDGLGVIANSAAGKSTLARLLVGAWTPDSGEIRFDGATPDQWDPDSLGRAIGYLPQSVELLHGTVRDNICRFDPEAESADVIEAARMAGVHDMVLALPDGYATVVGGQDTPLSGGQVQRLGLARAIYGNPSVVVLDEPNSNLDAMGDAALNTAIMKMREAGTTVIVMAHKPSVLSALNKIMILQGGAIAGFGLTEAILGSAGPGLTAPSKSNILPPDPIVPPSSSSSSSPQQGQGPYGGASQNKPLPPANDPLPRSNNPVFNQWRN